MKKKDMVFAVLAVMMAVMILTVVISGISHRKPAPEAPRPIEMAKTETRVEYVEKLVEVKKEISVDTIQDGLRDIGVLVTGEYYFTETADYSSSKSLWKFTLPGAQSEYLVSYDGVVTAGIDFGAVGVTKNEDSRVLTVTLPKPEIRNVDIDPDSFKLHYEKQGTWNPISVADYNESLKELENTARDKAISRNLLKNAEKNAELLVYNFAAGFLNGEDWTVVCVTA